MNRAWVLPWNKFVFISILWSGYCQCPILRANKSLEPFNIPNFSYPEKSRAKIFGSKTRRLSATLWCPSSSEYLVKISPRKSITFRKYTVFSYITGRHSSPNGIWEEIRVTENLDKEAGVVGGWAAPCSELGTVLCLMRDKSTSAGCTVFAACTWGARHERRKPFPQGASSLKGTGHQAKRRERWLVCAEESVLKEISPWPSTFYTTSGRWGLLVEPVDT